MKNTDLFEAIGEIDDRLIKNAKQSKSKFRNFVFSSSTATVAIILAIAILIGAIIPFFNRDFITTPIVSRPTLENYSPAPEKFEKFALTSSNAVQLSAMEILNKKQEFYKKNFTISDFVAKTANLFLTENNTQNYTYSPLNLFFALAMLAETTDGNSRKQILDVLSYNDMNSLREDAAALIEIHNFDNERGICTVSNSLWLSEDYKFNIVTLDKIAEVHRGASYYGNFSNPEYVTAFKEWINNGTKGILKNFVDKINVSPDSVMQLVSTMYFSSEWTTSFDSASSSFSIFNTPSGKIRCEFMNKYKSQEISYYISDNYTKVSLPTHSSVKFSVYLPDKGVSIEEILENGFGSEKRIDAKVNLSIPKFNFTSQYDLIQMLPNLGITDIFDSSTSDFSPILESGEGLYISRADHSTGISIDEKGCTAAAVTIFGGTDGGISDPKEVDFIVDRPFIFVIESLSNVPLFIGVVNDPCSF